MKPILFNTKMVRAIQNGTKTVTRRVVKPHPKLPYCHDVDGEWFWTSKDADDDMMDWWPSYENGLRPPYHPGDILYVRETWTQDGDVYRYKAGFYDQNRKWRPSIHMPREAARIFLRVTDVRVERLQDIDDDKALKEGCGIWGDVDWIAFPAEDFKRVWESTIKKADRALYGWDANPWVWVIEFERCEKPKEGQT